MVISDYHRAFVEAFGRDDVKAPHLHALRKRYGWKVGREPGRFVGRQRNRRYSAEELSFIESRQSMSRRALHEAFVKEFVRSDIKVDDIKALCTRNGWKTGRDGHFEKGATPANKGKKMPFNANSAQTQFKKGNLTGRANVNYKPVGAERRSKEGYVERKVHDGLPLQSRWRGVHMLLWEEINGPVPEGHCLKCLDGNKGNTHPSNWALVPRALLPRLNGKWGRGYDAAPAELKPVIMTVVKMEHMARKLRRTK
ncbi:HNH endonuclease [Mesorhizobium sp. NBSH29]|nr:HNH endonuclease [Mesorhizobium sp. NBSH29]